MAETNSIVIPPRVKDLTGKVFGRLTAVSFSGFIEYTCPSIQRVFRASAWLCRCECGRELVVRASDIARGNTRSCGCLKTELTIRRLTSHGMACSTEYRSWKQMLERCYNPRRKCYDRYGGRGIEVCERWRTSLAAFLADMGPKPTGHHISVERLDNDGNYEPGNCVWATTSEQSRNKSNTVRLTFDGRTQCLTDWAEELGMGRQTLWVRLNRLGWSVERALMEPVRHRASSSSATPSL